jgi:aminoglycoside phosphotransferase family enzyme/predicted kinase
MSQSKHSYKEAAQLTLTELIEELSAPDAYPYSVDEVEVRQTHISAVFLAGSYVYKVKKPVDYGFLDFGTLDKRRHYCDEEVRLNRRLAPDVYLGVVPVTRCDERLCLEGQGEIIEWAVKMRRLPDGATLQNRLQQDDVDVQVMQKLAGRIADFHASAAAGPRVAAFGRFEVVAGNARENFEQSVAHIGTTVSDAVFTRVKTLTEDALTRHRPLIESRAERGIPRDTHGDLRLDHVYVFPDCEPPGDLVIIDCIEFTERFRFADPIADMAFLIMGLHLRGRRDLGREFLDAYIRTSGDGEGRALVPFYTAYRAVVRGKVEGLKLSRTEITDADRAVALTKARGSWLLALGELETARRKPCLLLVAGLPGTGKSTLAQAVAEQADFRVIRSDVVRKELAGVAIEHRTASAFGTGIYTAEWTRRTYEECLRQAEELLFEGKRVLVDANFRDEACRRTFLDAATRWGTPTGILVCDAAPEVVRERLKNRRNDVSDADWSVYELAAEGWEEPSVRPHSALQIIDTGGSVEHAISQAIDALRQWDLYAGE